MVSVKGNVVTINGLQYYWKREAKSNQMSSNDELRSWYLIPRSKEDQYYPAATINHNHSSIFYNRNKPGAWLVDVNRDALPEERRDNGAYVRTFLTAVPSENAEDGIAEAKSRAVQAVLEMFAGDYTINKFN